MKSEHIENETRILDIDAFLEISLFMEVDLGN